MVWRTIEKSHAFKHYGSRLLDWGFWRGGGRCNYSIRCARDKEENKSWRILSMMQILIGQYKTSLQHKQIQRYVICFDEQVKMQIISYGVWDRRHRRQDISVSHLPAVPSPLHRIAFQHDDEKPPQNNSGPPRKREVMLAILQPHPPLFHLCIGSVHDVFSATMLPAHPWENLPCP